MIDIVDVTYESLRAVWPRTVGRENFGMDSLARRVADTETLNICPDYQRGRVWSNDQCSRFIGYLAEGGECPALWVQRWADASRPDELLDGLQRVTAILRFLANEVPMELTDGTRAYLRDLDQRSQRMLTGTVSGPSLCIQYVQYETRAEVLRQYLRLNRGGTVHSDAEIDRVRNLLAAEEP